ncbi:MAG: GNAT family N-acetyltransferase [Bryobacteraceae bacterium]|nr:GNAT family N-acetyltransferase [Bryobacteraceae bacterium]
MSSVGAPFYSVRAYEAGDAPGLFSMYQGFEPRGSAMGLPPMRAERTHDWLEHLGSSAHNLIALVNDRIIGHAILAKSDTDVAELAVFVRQEYRRRGVGTALSRAAAAQARTLGYRRLWAAGSADNAPAIRMVMKCGFHRASGAAGEMELDL